MRGDDWYIDMPSKQTLKNRTADCERLQETAGSAFVISYRDEWARHGYVVERVVVSPDEGRVSHGVFGPARFEVVHAFLIGIRYARAEAR